MLEQNLFKEIGFQNNDSIEGRGISAIGKNTLDDQL